MSKKEIELCFSGTNNSLTHVTMKRKKTPGTWQCFELKEYMIRDDSLISQVTLA